MGLPASSLAHCTDALHDGQVDANRQDLLHREQEPIEHLGTEVLAALSLHPRDRRLDRPRGAVDPVADQRLEDVGDRGDPPSSGISAPASPGG